MVRKILISAMFCFALKAVAFIEVGDPVPKFKWKDMHGNTLSIEENIGVVQVLLYNGGFCPGCNDEMAELVPQVGKYEGKDVKFISLSVAGWSSESLPDL